ncbi:MAG: hypothetical protein DMC60_02715 [Verrucomicrobia bacterium]|nr:MAG: hypothetical protein DMC60_02715 [Verrucomicrobiota bacterium]
MTATFDNLSAGDVIDGPKFAVSRESIRLFCDASLDYKSRWVLIDVVVKNQREEKVATGEALVEFPRDLFCQ